MIVLSTMEGVRAELDRARAEYSSIGLVPTMGALHDAHLSLVRAAKTDNDLVIVSIFVNPTQFGPSEDLADYPRDLDGDLALAEEAGVDIVFAPSVGEMYASDHATWIDVEGLSEGLCGRVRPGHFKGVCTVVAKLLQICAPTRAYFGEKDAQQLAVIERMVRDLNMRVEIVPCPIVREADGLAMSSRNRRLSSEARAQAPVLYRALSLARFAVDAGERSSSVLIDLIRATIAEAPMATVDYIEIVRADDLTSVDMMEGECLIAIAVMFGDVRLIDNTRVTV